MPASLLCRARVPAAGVVLTGGISGVGLLIGYGCSVMVTLGSGIVLFRVNTPRINNSAANAATASAIACGLAGILPSHRCSGSSSGSGTGEVWCLCPGGWYRNDSTGGTLAATGGGTWATT